MREIKFNDSRIVIPLPKGLIPKDKGDVGEPWVWQGYVHEGRIELIKVEEIGELDIQLRDNN